MKEKFEYINFHKRTFEIIDHANLIIDEMKSQGFVLTLRQLYYQFVSRGLIENTVKSYDKLGKTINDARLSGWIDWSAIEDRTRNLETNSHWGEPSEIIETCVETYAIDKWQEQNYRPEVWIEKEALASVIEVKCSTLDVSWFCCRGYVSQSEMYHAGKRLKGLIEGNTQKPVILYFGDHDPSGLDMSRDIKARLDLFSGYDIQVERIALNHDQVRNYKLPENPAKNTDTRFEEYRAKYGLNSWELDALDPQVIIGLIESSVSRYRDDALWETALMKENKDRLELKEICISLDNQDD